MVMMVMMMVMGHVAPSVSRFLMNLGSRRKIQPGVHAPWSTLVVEVVRNLLGRPCPTKPIGRICHPLDNRSRNSQRRSEPVRVKPMEELKKNLKSQPETSRSEAESPTHVMLDEGDDQRVLPGRDWTDRSNVL